MDRSFYKTKSDKWFTGRRARTLIDIVTTGVVIPAGTVALIVRKHWGLTLRFDPCDRCGLAVVAERVQPEDVQLIDVPVAAKPGGPKRKDGLDDLLR